VGSRQDRPAVVLPMADLQVHPVEGSCLVRLVDSERLVAGSRQGHPAVVLQMEGRPARPVVGSRYLVGQRVPGRGHPAAGNLGRGRVDRLEGRRVPGHLVGQKARVRPVGSRGRRLAGQIDLAPGGHPAAGKAVGLVEMAVGQAALVDQNHPVAAQPEGAGA
jgi:hypothetical protein